jgi:hypothetical protein
MKTNKLSLIVLFCLALLGLSSIKTMAQGRFSIGANLGLPMGSFGDAANVGFGGTVAYESSIKDKLNWTATAGYLTYSIKGSTSGASASTNMIPILGGVKYYMNESFNGFYVSGQLGFTIASIAYDFSSIGAGTGSVSETDFTIAPGVGYHLANIDIGASYQIISNLNYVGIRAAYVFGGK